MVVAIIMAMIWKEEDCNNSAVITCYQSPSVVLSDKESDSSKAGDKKSDLQAPNMGWSDEKSDSSEWQMNRVWTRKGSERPS